MHPFTVEAQIARPREDVFEYLLDIANHAEFTDHFLRDWRMTREETYGLGAGGRFRADIPFTRFSWGDVTIVDADDPQASCCRAGPGSTTGSARSPCSSCARRPAAGRACP